MKIQIFILLIFFTSLLISERSGSFYEKFEKDLSDSNFIFRRRRRHNPPPPPPKQNPPTPAPVQQKPFDVGVTNNALWNKYRHVLMLSISKQFCNGQQTCNELSTTGAQMVTDATTCDWNNNEELTKMINYAPKYGPSYKINVQSFDGQISELYRKFLLQCPNQQEGLKRFINFEKSTKLWEEKTSPLHDLINTYKNRYDRNYKFSFDVNTPENLANNPRSNLGSWYTSNKGFIREVSNKASSDFIFGGTKKVYHTVIVKEVKVTLSSKFRVSFSAVDVVPIKIEPATNWFDYQFLKDNKETLKNMGYLGQEGKLSLLPKILYVAFKPQIEIIISKSQYENMKTSLEQPSTLGYLVGGLTFAKPTAVPLSDSEKKGDQIILNRPKKLPKEKKEKFEKDFEKEFDEIVSDKFLSDFIFRNSASSHASSDRVLSDWLFRRRTKHITIVRREIQYVPEGDFKVVFTSNGDHPQLLAVVSDRL